MGNKNIINFNSKGSVTAEFIIIFPTFLFLCMFIIEISLLWKDRHILHLATFEAARACVIEGFDDEGNFNQKAANAAAQSAAVKKLSFIAPSALSLLKEILGDSEINKQVIELNNTINTDFIGSRVEPALKKYFLSYPAAYALTTAKCTVDKDGYVTADVNYLRTPKMPFVGPALWATYIIQQLNKSGLKTAVQFNLDNYYFGIKANSPVLDKFNKQYKTYKKTINNILTKSIEVGATLKNVSTLIKDVPSPQVKEMASAFNTASNKITTFQSVFKSKLNNGDDKVESEIEDINKVLNDQAKVLTSAIYAVPNSLRLIPMHTSIKLYKTFNPTRNIDEWDNGLAYIVAPFSIKDKPSDISDDLNTWETWAKAMGGKYEFLK